jgi:hypothetical protein
MMLQKPFNDSVISGKYMGHPFVGVGTCNGRKVTAKEDGKRLNELLAKQKHLFSKEIKLITEKRGFTLVSRRLKTMRDYWVHSLVDSEDFHSVSIREQKTHLLILQVLFISNLFGYCGIKLDSIFYSRFLQEFNHLDDDFGKWDKLDELIEKAKNEQIRKHKPTAKARKLD